MCWTATRASRWQTGFFLLCGTAAAEAPVFSDHPDRQGICTDGLAADFMQQICKRRRCLRRWMYLPEGR
ncbi:MAG: hypothetical protein ACLR3S_02815 [Clostridium fessum]